MTYFDFQGGPVTASYNSGADKVTVQVRGVEYGVGAPSTLPANILYIEQDAGPPTTQRAMWLGTSGGNVKMVDLNPNIISGTGAQRGAVPGPNIPTDALFAVTDNSPYAQGIYQNQGGVWVGVGPAGAIPRTKEWRISGVQTVGSTDWAWTPMRPGTILEVQASAVKTPPSGQPLIVDLQKNGTTLDAVNRATIPANATSSPNAVPVAATYSAFDLIKPVVTQIGVQPPAIPGVRESNVTSTSATATTISIPRSPLAQTGDLFAVALSVQNDAVTPVPPAGTGWVLRNTGGTVYATGTGRLWVYTRVDDGSAGPWSFQFVLTSDMTTVTSVTRFYKAIVLNNVHATTPVPDAAATGVDNTFNTTMTTPSLTTTVANQMELLFIRPSSSVSAWTTGPADNGYTVPNLGSLHIAYITRATSGTFAGQTYTGPVSYTAATVRLAVQGAGTPGTWSPGEDLLIQARYTES